MVNIVVDFEMTCTTKHSGPAEIIEIGAAKLDELYNIIDTFQTYVKPDHPENIGSRCTKITGITRLMVDSAPKLNDTLQSFGYWIASHEAIIYEWSEADHMQLKEECRLKFNMDELPPVLSNWVNAQKLFSKTFGVAEDTNLGQALNIAGILFDGREHSALADAINTARLVALMNDSNYVKKMEQTLGNLFNTNNEVFGSSIGDMIRAKNMG